MNIPPVNNESKTEKPRADAARVRTEPMPPSEPPDEALERHDTIPAPTWMGDEPEHGES